MKNILKYSIVLLLVFSFTLISCNDNTSEETPTKTTLLTAGKWSGETQKVYTNDVLTNTVDITNQELELLANYEFKAYTNSVIDTTGNWSLSTNEEKITLFGGEDFTINELTTSKFIFTLHTTIGGNQTKVIYTYTQAE